MARHPSGRPSSSSQANRRCRLSGACATPADYGAACVFACPGAVDVFASQTRVNVSRSAAMGFMTEGILKRQQLVFLTLGCASTTRHDHRLYGIAHSGHHFRLLQPRFGTMAVEGGRLLSQWLEANCRSVDLCARMGTSKASDDTNILGSSKSLVTPTEKVPPILKQAL